MKKEGKKTKGEEKRREEWKGGEKQYKNNIRQGGREGGRGREREGERGVCVYV